MEQKHLSDFQEFSENNFTKRVVYKKGESVVFVLNFKPGQELPSHKHLGTQVFLSVLEGSGTINTDGKETLINKDDLINVGGDEQFSFKNTGESNLSLYVILSKIPDERYAQNV
jgi:mannose-6-phosphate isomerase-like protein (cupin superfamily)